MQYGAEVKLIDAKVKVGSQRAYRFYADWVWRMWRRWATIRSNQTTLLFLGPLHVWVRTYQDRK